MLTMDNIVREGHPSLRERAKEVDLPISQEIKDIGEAMMTFVQNSQDEELAEKYQLRAGVGLAAPQIDRSVRVAAVHIEDEDGNVELSEVFVNPKIIRQSVKKKALPGGEGCLSVDREVPGLVPRPRRITLQYTDLDNQAHEIKLKDYHAIVVQHEIDHLNGVMFYDHINEDNPFELRENESLLDLN